jgi:hypothetical protein
MTKYTLHDVQIWLTTISNGTLGLQEDNVGLAEAALDFLVVDTDDSVPIGYLTEHFTVDEMIHSDTANQMGIDNYPSPKEMENLQQVCDVLELIRMTCGSKSVIVSSGYRCPELNRAVGGVADSAHIYGLAADITIPEYGSTARICEAIKPHLQEWHIDQLIDECSGSVRWVHVGLRDPLESARCEYFEMEA